jgi:hypothetical protein
MAKPDGSGSFITGVGPETSLLYALESGLGDAAEIAKGGAVPGVRRVALS